MKEKYYPSNEFGQELRLGDDAKDQFFLGSLRPIKSWMKAAFFWSWEAAS